MISFTTHDLLLFSRKEIWFYNNEPVDNFGYSVYISALQPPLDKSISLTRRQTLTIDLTKSEEELFSQIQARTRSYINTGEKQNLKYKYDFHPTDADCEEVAKQFNKFARRKGILPINNKWMKAAQRSNSICLTKMSSECKDIATHIYLLNTSRVILTHSFHDLDQTGSSSPANANKLMHWKDLILFKSKEIKCYDFGGANPKLEGITGFKNKFGGDIAETYNYVKANYLIGMAVRLLKIFKK